MRPLPLFAVLGLIAGAPADATADAVGDAEPHLVVLVVIDQLRPERLQESLPGGLGHLVRGGRIFVDAAVDHSNSETCPGHVAIATGRHPGPVGVPGNSFIERESGAKLECVTDRSPATESLDGTGGRSPRQFRASALGDWLKASRPDSRVFAVSAKDRAAIPLGGQRPDGAYWLSLGETLGFTTSRYYRDALPEWVARFNRAPRGDGFLGGLPPNWVHESGDPANGARRDVYSGEDKRFSNHSPHPLADPDPRVSAPRVFFSPYLDDITLDFARSLVENEKLGAGPGVDLLAISLSATDFVGHYYGPESQEARDALLHLDAAFAEFLSFVEARVGKDGLLVALVSDHGVMELPDWLVDTGRGECPVPGGRINPNELLRVAEETLNAEFGPPQESDDWTWLRRAGFRISINRDLLPTSGAKLETVVERCRQILAAQPGIERVWTRQEIQVGTGPEPFARLYHNSYDPEREGDLVVQPARDCLFSRYPEGTSHGTPYLYDRAVPLIFYGAGVEPGRVRGRAGVVDLAPSLARALGVEVPPGIDGRPLPLSED